MHTRATTTSTSATENCKPAHCTVVIESPCLGNCMHSGSMGGPASPPRARSCCGLSSCTGAALSATSVSSPSHHHHHHHHHHQSNNNGPAAACVPVVLLVLLGAVGTAVGAYLCSLCNHVAVDDDQGAAVKVEAPAVAAELVGVEVDAAGLGGGGAQQAFRRLLLSFLPSC
eukprot:SAG25_NODE_1448_length_2998_cov_1.666782_4_plen_171_part_00